MHYPARERKMTDRRNLVSYKARERAHLLFNIHPLQCARSTNGNLYA